MLRGLRRGTRFAVQNALIRMRRDAVSIREIDPQDIRFVQFPELWTTLPRGARPLSAQRIPGPWDEIDRDATVFWSGRYESPGRHSRMIPIENFGFYRACVARFVGGESWEATDWFRWLVARIEAGDHVRRYATREETRARLELLDRMFAEFRRGEYQSERDRQARETNALARWIQRPSELGEPIVNLGRRNQVSIEDGRHRLCLARIAGVPRVRVRVGAIHAEAGA